MPEVGIGPHFSKLVEDRIKATQSNISQPAVAAIVDTTDENRLQGGQESAIIRVDEQDSDNYKIVTVSFNEMTPEYAKYLYYTHNIFETLFPHNFPHFQAAFASNPSEGHFAGTVREGVVPPKKEHAAIRALKAVIGKGETIKYPFGEVIEKCKEYQIPLTVDTYEKNFLPGKDGGEYYVDTIKPLGIDGRFGVVPWNLRAIQQYISDKPYEDELQRKRDMDSVTNKLHRLQDLGLITLAE